MAEHVEKLSLIWDTGTVCGVLKDEKKKTKKQSLYSTSFVDIKVLFGSIRL